VADFLLLIPSCLARVRKICVTNSLHTIALTVDGPLLAGDEINRSIQLYSYKTNGSKAL
jgi:hypothetical protein